MELKHQLTSPLKQLRLSGILETLDARHRQAIDGKWSYVEFLERLLQDEGIVRHRGKIEAVINNAKRAKEAVKIPVSMAYRLFTPDLPDVINPFAASV